jgi:hypothetical protein
MSWRTRTFVLAALAAVLVSAPYEMRAVAQDQGDGPSPSVLSVFSGGAAEGKRGRTETAAVAIPVGVWFTLPNAQVTWFVPSGDSDLLNVSFSAECTKSGVGRLLIRVQDNGVNMTPGDNGQVFCSATTAAVTQATHAGLWMRRAAGAFITGTNHTIRVQVFNTGNAATIDDWSLELVAYN